MKAALVTGASGGLGRAVVEKLREAGWWVAAHRYRHSLGAFGDGVIELPADLRRPEQVTDMLQRLQEASDRLDLVVHCAGGTHEALCVRTSATVMDKLIDLNLTTAYRVLRGTVPLLESGGGGQALLVSSLAARTGRAGLSAYAAAKAGLHGLALTAARELANRRVRVNIVMPGFLMTAMGAGASGKARDRARRDSLLGSWSEPADAARLIVALADTKGVTGQVFSLDSRVS